MTVRQYRWTCAIENCGATKGPYYDRTQLREAIAEHNRMQHVAESPAMEPSTRADGRMRAASHAGAGYEPPTW